MKNAWKVNLMSNQKLKNLISYSFLITYETLFSYDFHYVYDFFLFKY